MKLKDITEEDIIEIADTSAIVGRGRDYYESGQVKAFRVEGNRIIAKVLGSYGTYDTEISIENDELDASCSCPYEGYGCKHIVAVLYKWINEKDNVITAEVVEEKQMDINKELAKLDKEKLVSMLIEFSRGNEDIKRDLLIRLSKSTSKDDFPGKQIILNQIREAFRTGRGFIDYRELPSIIMRLFNIKKAVMKYPAGIRAFLLERLATNAVSAYEHCDDSDADLATFIGECLEKLGKAIREQNLSFEEKKKIMLKALDDAEKDDYGFSEDYHSMLLEIPDNKEDFDFLISEIKNRMMQRKSKYEVSDYESLLEGLYKRGKYDDEYLAILTRDMQQGKEYWPLVEFWKERGQMEKAVRLAEEGIKYTENKIWTRNTQLFDFLENFYAAQNRQEDLLRIKLLYFASFPSLTKYKEIKKLCKNWSKVRPKLMKEVGGQTAIEIHLFEGEFEEAFERVMQEGHCTD